MSYPRIDPPHKQPDGTYLITVHKAPGEVEEVPAADLPAARELIRFLERASTILIARTRLEEPAPAGRPTKLTSKLRDEFYDAVSVGCSWADACDMCDITYATFKNWRHRAQEGEEPFAAFFAGLKKHRARGKYQHWKRISRGEQNWQASARWLEAIEPRFARRTEVSATGGGVTVSFHRPIEPGGASDTIAEVVVDGLEVAGEKKPGGNGRST